MKDVIKQLIVEFQEEQTPEPVPREITLSHFAKNIRKAQVFMGMRRSGKTWIMYQDIQQRLHAKCPKSKLLYINFEDDRLARFTSENFQDILAVYFELYPENAHDDEVVFYFDEIHLINNWEKFIRRLLDKEKMKVYVTGSSAKMLSKEIATSLRGRAIETEVFPFNFKEYLNFHQIKTAEPLTLKNQASLFHHSERYFQTGGFPETLFIPQDQHREILQGYVNTVIFRDVVDRYQVSNSPALKHYLLHCLQNISASLSITRIYHALKSAGTNIGRNSLYEYLDYFEESYLLFTVPLYDLSLRKRQINPKKIYTIDPGIVSAYSVNPSFSQGPAFENVVFLHLRRIFTDIYYYRTQTLKEVDFAIVTTTGSIELYQACINLGQEKTLKREISALIEAANELNASALYIISYNHDEVIEVDNLTIKIIPFWKWAL